MANWRFTPRRFTKIFRSRAPFSKTVRLWKIFRAMQRVRSQCIRHSIGSAFRMSNVSFSHPRPHTHTGQGQMHSAPKARTVSGRQLLEGLTELKGLLSLSSLKMRTIRVDIGGQVAPTDHEVFRGLSDHRKRTLNELLPFHWHRPILRGVQFVRNCNCHTAPSKRPFSKICDITSLRRPLGVELESQRWWPDPGTSQRATSPRPPNPPLEMRLQKPNTQTPEEGNVVRVCANWLHTTEKSKKNKTKTKTKKNIGPHTWP